VIKKKAEKILKYKDLIIETQHMWNVKAKVIPVIIGATGPFHNKSLISSFRLVQYVVCFLLGNYSDLPAYEDGTDRLFRNVGI